MDVDTNLSDKCEARKGVRRISRPRKEELEDRRSHESLIETILNGSEGLHHAINDFLYGQIKDGVAKATAIATLKGLMMSNPNKDERWQSRFDEIERSADGAIEKINIESNDRYTNSREILENLGLSKVNNEKPEYPFDTMRKWPHPWPLIWKNWKRFPAVVSEPLLVPTIIAFHGFMLNSKYLNARDRRPNLYQLSLAESTAYKDTNSTDVLRAMPTAMARHGIFNSIFDNLADGDSNISSDTALIKSLSENNGKKFWINTEATRVFQQLSTVSKGNMNPSVLALADKIIEVVDGKTITGKVKATEAMKSITDPNVQIVFYAQPETIERYITEEMVDSGFLGRALITLDVTETQEHSMFMQLPDNHCQLDSDIAEFYGNCNLNEKAFFERYKCILKDENLNSAIKFEKDVLRPMMPVNDGPLRKMITRMGNSTEQLYSIVLGVCREWDAWQGNEIRESVSIDPLFDLLEFFAKCKHYVVNEYILESSDPVADSIVEGVTRFLDGTWTCERRYREFVKDGYVPRSILVNRVRSMKKVQDQASGYARMTGIISQTIDYMIFNQTLGQTEKSIGKSSKKTKFIYVAR
jgi:hypothetical protein